MTLDVTLDEIDALGGAKDVVKSVRGHGHSSDGTIGTLFERCQPNARPAGHRDLKHCLAVAIRQREGMHLDVPAARRQSCKTVMVCRVGLERVHASMPSDEVEHSYRVVASEGAYVQRHIAASHERVDDSERNVRAPVTLPLQTAGHRRRVAVQYSYETSDDVHVEPAARALTS